MASEFNWNDIDQPYLAGSDVNEAGNEQDNEEDEDEDEELEVLLRSVQED